MKHRVKDAIKIDRRVMASTPIAFVAFVLLGVIILSYNTAKPTPKAVIKNGQSTAILWGFVTDKDSGAKLPRASVKIGEKVIMTDNDGNFYLAGLPVGKTSFSIALPGYVETVFNTTLRIPSEKIEYELVSVFRASNEKPKYEPTTPEVIRRGNPNRKRVAFTFDDGWYPDYRIIDLMRENGLRGTAFLIGGRGVVNAHPELVRKLDEAGFEVATHGYGHKTITDLDETQLNEEIRKGQAGITELNGKQYPYFRCSGGVYNERTLNIVASNGYKLVLWSLDSYDSRKGYTTRGRADNLLANLHNGAIIVFHLGGYETYDLLSILIPEIQARGYDIGTVTDVMAP